MNRKKERRRSPDLHTAVERYIFSILPKGEAFLEYRVHEHIADIAWINEKIVFEVQCSYLPPSEALRRAVDYKALGFDVVWILHQKMFNKHRVSHLEYFLRENPCYYTNISAGGLGIIYDQYEEHAGRRRIYRSPPFEVDLSKPKRRRDFLSFNGDRFDRPEEIIEIKSALNLNVMSYKGFLASWYENLLVRLIGHLDK